MGAPVNIQVENGRIKLFNLQGQTINTSDKAVFTLNDSGFQDEDRKKINTSDPLTAAQRQSGRFLCFMMTLHPYQADPNLKHSLMTFRACVKLLIYVDGIYTSINTQMLKTSHGLLVHLEALDNVIKP